MTETEKAEIAYTETQYGIRIKGEVQPIAVGPAEAERYRVANVDIHARARTVYRDQVTAWRPLNTAATNPPPDNRDPAGCASEESADV